MASNWILLAVLLYALLLVTPVVPCTVVSGEYYYDAEITICSSVQLTCSLAENTIVGAFLDATFDAIVTEGAFVGPPIQLEASVCPEPVPYVAKCCSWNNKNCGSSVWCDSATSNCEGGCGGTYINPLETTQCLALWSSCKIGGTECCGNAECFIHQDGWRGCEPIGSGLVRGIQEDGCCSRDGINCPTWDDSFCSLSQANCNICAGKFIKPTLAPTRSPTKSPTRTPTKTPTRTTSSTPTRAPTKTPTKTPTRASVCKARYAGCASNSECCSGNCWYASTYNTWKECLYYRREDRTLKDLGGQVELSSVHTENMSEEEYIAGVQRAHMDNKHNHNHNNVDISLWQGVPERRDATVYKQVTYVVNGLCRLCPIDNGDRKLGEAVDERQLLLSTPATPFTGIENVLKRSMDSYLADALNTKFAKDPNSCMFGNNVTVTVQFTQVATPPATNQVC